MGFFVVGGDSDGTEGVGLGGGEVFEFEGEAGEAFGVAVVLDFDGVEGGEVGAGFGEVAGGRVGDIQAGEALMGESVDGA